MNGLRMESWAPVEIFYYPDGALRPKERGNVRYFTWKEGGGRLPIPGYLVAGGEEDGSLSAAALVDLPLPQRPSDG